MGLMARRRDRLPEPVVVGMLVAAEEPGTELL